MKLSTFSRALTPLTLAAVATAQSTTWIGQLGSSRADFALGAAPDTAGGFFLGGDTSGSLGGPQVGLRDVWFARMDSNGKQLWIRQLGQAGYDGLSGVAADGSGGVFVCGMTDGQLIGPQVGGVDGWIAHYDGSGNQLWGAQVGSSTRDDARGPASDGAGGVFVAGSTSGNFGAPNAGRDDAWIARYDSVGNLIWVRQFGTSTIDLAGTTAPDGAGGVFVAGSTEGSLGGTFAGLIDVWLAHYSSNGNQLWIRQLGTSVYDYVWAAVPDASGGCYVMGTTCGSLGGATAGDYDAWIARYDAAGNQLWIRQFGSSAGEGANAGAPDGAGGLLVTGITSGNLSGYNAGHADLWVARYDSAGNQLWIQQDGSSALEWAYGVAADLSGGAYVVGATWGDFGGSGSFAPNAYAAHYELAPARFCTSKASSLAGCIPTLVGPSPSVSKSGGTYVCTAGPVPGGQGRAGVLLATTSGLLATPLNTPYGDLCLNQRALLGAWPSTSGGTSGSCSGSYSFNLHAAVAATPAIPVGATLCVQAWYRDQGFAPPGNGNYTQGIGPITVYP